MEITIEMVMSWEPCAEYTEDRLLELAGGRSSLTPLECLELPIPPKHIFWLLLRPEIIPERELRLLACTFLDSAIEIYEKYPPKDFRLINARAARKFLVEGSSSYTAWDAAAETAWDAAWYAAWERGASLSERSAATAAAWAARLEEVKKVLERLLEQDGK